MGRHLSNSRRKTCQTRILYLAKTFFKNKDKDFSDKKTKKVKTVTSRPMIQKKKKVEGSFTVFLQEKEAFQAEERQRQVKTQIHAKEREA